MENYLSYDAIRWPGTPLKSSYVAAAPKHGGPAEALGPLTGPDSWERIKKEYDVLYTGTREDVITYVKAYVPIG